MDIGAHRQIVADAMRDGPLVVETGGTIVYAAAATRTLGASRAPIRNRIKKLGIDLERDVFA